MSARQDKWYQENKKEILKERKDWYKKNPKKARAKQAEYRKKYPERVKAAAERFRVKTPLEVYLWRGAKTRAKNKGWDFSIKVSDIVLVDLCPVLGLPLVRNRARGPIPQSPTLDRVNSSLGYVRGNIRVISHRANQLKSNATVEEMECVLKDLKRIEDKKCVQTLLSSVGIKL